MFKIKQIIDNKRNLNEFIFAWYMFSYLIFLPLSILLGENVYRVFYYTNLLFLVTVSIYKNRKILKKNDIFLIGIGLCIYITDVCFRYNDYTNKIFFNFFKMICIPCYFFNRITNVKALINYMANLSQIAFVFYFFDPFFKYQFHLTYMQYGVYVTLPTFCLTYINHFIKRKNTDILFLVLSFFSILVYSGRTCILSVLLLLTLTYKFIFKDIIKIKKKHKLNKSLIIKNGTIIVLLLITFSINLGLNKIIKNKENDINNETKSIKNSENKQNAVGYSYSLKKYEQMISGQYNTILSGRQNIYTKAIEIIKDTFLNSKIKFILGNGTGYFWSANKGVYTHCIIFDLIIEYGFLGFSLFVAIGIYCFIKWIKRTNRHTYLLGAYFFSFAIPRALLSSYFQIELYLWLFIIYAMSNFFYQESRKKRDKIKIKMILDNCFDSDIRVYKEALYLVEKGNDVEILCLDKKNKYIDKQVDTINGIKVKRFFSRTDKTTKLIEKNVIIRKFKYIIYLWWLVKFFIQLKKYLKNEHYDILHCHDLTMAFCASLFIKNRMIVFDMHEYYKNKKNRFSNFIIDKLVRYTQNKSSWIIYVNDLQLKDLKEKNKKKTIYLPNYPKEEDYLPIEKTSSSDIRVNYIGRLRDYNSLKTLTNITEISNNIKVTLYGGGDCFERLKKENTSEKVCIYGIFNGVTDSSKIYRDTDILYCVYNPQNANWQMSYPVKLYEGIITKTPIIVAKGSKASELIKKYNIGEVVEYNNISDLKNSILKIKNNYSQYVSNLEKIRKEFMWSDIIKNLDKYLY